MPATYFPRISNLISSEDLHISKFEFVCENMDNFLESQYYRNYSFGTSISGDSRTIQLEILIKGGLDLVIPGLGDFGLVLNYVEGESEGFTSIPLKCVFKLDALRLLKGIDIESVNTDHSPVALFNLFMRILNIDINDLLPNLIFPFIDIDDNQIDAVDITYENSRLASINISWNTEKYSYNEFGFISQIEVNHPRVYSTNSSYEYNIMNNCHNCISVKHNH